MPSTTVRLVPKDWQHPRDKNGQYIALFDGKYFEPNLKRWEAEAALWERGFYLDFEKRELPKDALKKSMSYAEWGGDRPDPKDYMPVFESGKATYYQMYETCSEGTPISPVMDTPSSLAKWMVEYERLTNDTSPSTYEEWLSHIKAEIPIITITPGKTKIPPDNSALLPPN